LGAEPSILGEKMDTIIARMKKLMDIIRAHVADKSALEEANKIFYGEPSTYIDRDDFAPIIYPDIDPAPFTMAQICKICGINMASTMGYVCSNSRCPTKITCN
jgi:hypothetical protein